MSKQSDFIGKVKNGAIQGQKDYKVLASASIAQAILESGWGTASIAVETNNLFGILANGWIVNIYHAPNGLTYRKYPNTDASIEDHASFLFANSRYKNIIGNTDYKSVCHNLQNDGYAGNQPNYATSLISLIEQYNLTQYDIKTVTFGVAYKGQVQNIGWQNSVDNGELCGTVGKGLQLEAIIISLLGAPAGLKVKYRTHVQNIGWQPWVYDRAVAGTVGKGLQIEAIEIMLEGTDATKYNIEYQTHVQNIGWQPWVKNGVMAGTTGKSLQVEAIQIKIS